MNEVDCFSVSIENGETDEGQIEPTELQVIFFTSASSITTIDTAYVSQSW